MHDGLSVILGKVRSRSPSKGRYPPTGAMLGVEEGACFSSHLRSDQSLSIPAYGPAV